MPVGDTIVALASPPGRSARALIRLSGPATREALAALSAGPVRPFERACFRGALRLGEHRLPVLVATYRAPASYTGEDAAEILLPGNPYLVERVLAAFTALPGVRGASPGEFTARAFLNERLSLEQAEGVAATIAAASAEDLAAARDLLRGRTGDAYRAWAEELAALLALVEAGIDFTDQEDVVAIAPTELHARLARLGAEITARLGSPAGTEAVPALPRVVLAGAPNAGKSTLFNALLGRRRSVVSPEAGITRDALEEELDLSRDLPGAGPVLLVDLAGLQEGSGASEADAAAQRAARDALRRADVVLHCDPAGGYAQPAIPSDRPIIRIRTKADLPAPRADDAEALAVCALDGFNLAVLRRAIADAATGSRSAHAGALLPRHRRALAATLSAIEETIAPLAPVTSDVRHPTFGTDPALLASSLRGALDALGDLTGRITPDDIIGRIFATFCIGK